MYEKEDDGFFTVDAHVAPCDARPQNLLNVHGRQFTDCLYVHYRNLWPKTELRLDDPARELVGT